MFANKESEQYAKKLSKYMGDPSYTTPKSDVWVNIGPYLKIEVKDEHVPHSFPKHHFDFVYSTIKVPHISVDKACSLMKVSESIMIDVLKKEVTVRCGSLIKNDVTLSFVKDVLSGKCKATKKEYAYRINNDVVKGRTYKFGSYIDINDVYRPKSRVSKRRQNEVVKFMTELLRNKLQTGVPKGLQNDFKKGVKITVGNII